MSTENYALDAAPMEEERLNIEAQSRTAGWSEPGAFESGGGAERRETRVPQDTVRRDAGYCNAARVGAEVEKREENGMSFGSYGSSA